MTRFLAAFFVVLAVIVALIVVFRGQPQSVELSAAAMPSLAELHIMAGVHRLPDQDIEDQSFIFPAQAKQ